METYESSTLRLGKPMRRSLCTEDIVSLRFDPFSDAPDALISLNARYVSTSQARLAS